MAMIEEKKNIQKFMIIKIEDHKFALHLSLVREVIANQPMTLLPNMPDHFAGIINLRGKIISIFSLKECFKNLIHSEDVVRRPCIVISSVEGNFYGTLVDEVKEVISVSQDQIDYSTKLEKIEQDIFDGIIKFSDSSMAPILRVEKVLKIEELKNRLAS
jgi:purine-binding chemotaxis protein CheW